MKQFKAEHQEIYMGWKSEETRATLDHLITQHNALCDYLEKQPTYADGYKQGRFDAEMEHHQKLQKAREEALTEFNQRFEKLDDLDDIARTWLAYHVQKAREEERERIYKMLHEKATSSIITDFQRYVWWSDIQESLQSELDQDKK